VGNGSPYENSQQRPEASGTKRWCLKHGLDWVDTK
jgi:hypothetical protein